MDDNKFKFWMVEHEVSRILYFFEFWVFVTLRETHIIGWSWWWMVFLLAVSYCNMTIAYAKIRRIVK